MRYSVISLVALVLFFSCTSTDKPSTLEQENRDSVNQLIMEDSSKYTTIEWLDSTHQDLGKINEGQIVEITWTMRNTGNLPLVVTDVIKGCGCTEAKGPEKPVAPGETGSIVARFDSNNQTGNQTKQVTVRSNNKNAGGGTEILTFSVEVTPK